MAEFNLCIGMLAILCGLASMGERTAPLDCQIQTNGIAEISLGNNLHAVQQRYPQAQITRSSDGDGAALVSIALTPEIGLMAYTGEDDPTAAPDMQRPISYLETDSPACHTAAGVHPQMALAAAEQYYGKVRQITLSEIEARQFAEFARQPDGLHFQIDDAGIFKGNERTSRRYQPDARISYIGVGL